MKWNKQMQQYARKKRLVKKYEPIVLNIDFTALWESTRRFMQGIHEAVKRMCEEMNSRMKDAEISHKSKELPCVFKNSSRQNK